MTLTRDEKQAQVKDLTDKMQRASSVIFTHYIGLNVADLTHLRRQLKAKNAELKVSKKTLMDLAIKNASLPPPAPTLLDGPIGCIFSFADPLSGAQIAFKFGKDHAQVDLVGGIFEGKLLSKEEARSFAQMPSREMLLTIFAMMIRSPLVQFATMCSSPLSGFVRALNELSKKKTV
ncbi:50S ribosomal protein L10 [Candidatus Peregrinibacteria bacterium]|nr:50S ribosomal protein L10 [Candidatus Peregrinibacteria bacterium]